MSIILKAENISKQYRLGAVGTGTIADDLKRWWYGLQGKEDPFLKVGAINDRSSGATENYIWALRNVNFELQQGEVLGIIGKNGAGKSTLLKLLSRVTSPTIGSIKIKGKIASLLEVGTGFHGELTGRENIFMNGAVLGMTKKEIKTKMDEIITFSGCEKYIDTPVKRYSSGMTVRLGFAVAAHLEPDILVVDEVLAVGDAEFQKKAIGKMQDLSSNRGRTVILVSHNMASIAALCNRALVLEDGLIGFDGDVQDAINYYLFKPDNREIEISQLKDRSGNAHIKIIDIKIFQNNKRVKLDSLVCGRETIFKITIENFLSENLHFCVGLSFYTTQGVLLNATGSQHNRNYYKVSPKSRKLVFNSYDSFPLTEGKYILNISCSTREFGLEDFIKDTLILEVRNGNYFNKTDFNVPSESILLNNRWDEPKE